MAAYRYGRPHVGYQALMANALLTEQGALGNVTELLSGDFNAPFGRSSHHQVWSEAMVVTPLLRGLFGIETRDGGGTLHLRPQLPADWDRAAVQRIASGGASFDATLTRSPGRLRIEIVRGRTREGAGNAGDGPRRIAIAPAFPLDARVRAVRVDGRAIQPSLDAVGDVRFAAVQIDAPPAKTTVEYVLQDGSDVYVRREAPLTGDRSRGLRILRSRAEAAGLRLTLEGLGGQTYTLALRTPRPPGTSTTPGVKIESRPGADPQVVVTFDGPANEYVRREVLVPLHPSS
jgi:hypothetical protein